MKHRLLSLGLRGAVVGSALVFGCSQGHCPCAPGPVTPPGGPLPSAAAVARAEPPRPAHRPQVRILEVFPADSAIAQQEAALPQPGVPPHAVPSAVVRGARPEADGRPAAPFGHAPDYRWLTGELRYSAARGAWWVHYAAEEEEDRHGGSVTLVGAGALTGLRPGQAVRVEGEMIDPDARDPSPPYRVRSLRPYQPDAPARETLAGASGW